MRLEDRLLLLQAKAPRAARLLFRLLAMLRGFQEVGRRSMQRFTPAGRLLLGFYALSLLFVVDTRTTMNYQLFALLLAMLLLAFIFARLVRLPPGVVTAKRVLPRTAMAGAPLEYDLLLRNTGTRPQTSLQVLENLEPEHTAPPLAMGRMGLLSRQEAASLRVRLAWRRLLLGNEKTLQREASAPSLAPGREGRVRITAPPPRRGVLRFSRSAVAAPDPLGLFRTFTPLPAGQSLLVLPRRYPMPHLSLPGGRRHQPGGLRMASRVGEEGEFTSLREYRRGDPLRHIHWRSWARHGAPIVKEFQEEFFTRHAMVLDTFPDASRLPTPGDVACFEAAVSVAASITAAPRDQDALLDLLFVEHRAHCVTAGRGLGSSDELLEILAGATPCLDACPEDEELHDAAAPQMQGFARLAALALEHAPMVSGCVCILLAWDAPRRELVQGLRSRGVETLALLLPCGNASPLPTAEEDVRILHPERLEKELLLL